LVPRKPLRVDQLFTVGHSTRSAAEFVELLTAHGVTGIADVRAVPRSRRHPHFSQAPLRQRLLSEGIAYEHFRGLGGLRSPSPHSVNGAWRNGSFRGYADHMDSEEFRASVQVLLTFARKCAAAVMCAEAKWWQCHRQLIADALLVRGVEVRHIMSVREASRHELTPSARVIGSTVQYPGLVP
jgi:uncharacterized protein (DUF488 family)